MAVRREELVQVKLRNRKCVAAFGLPSSRELRRAIMEQQLLLPPAAIPQANPFEWKPQRYRSAPQPPPLDENKLHEQELANQRQVIDGKLIKRTRPRRTVDYNGPMGRWALVRPAILLRI